MNDETTLRTYGGKRDAYTVFNTLLDKGTPPDSWTDLAKAVGARAEKGAGGKKRRR